MAIRLPSPPTPDQVHVHLSPMRKRDLRGVLRIEDQVYPRPWSRSLFAGELALRSTRCYIVAKVGSRVVGYGGELFALEDAHITNIAVDPLWHRHQIGTRLLLTLARAAIARGATNFTLEVRVSNHGAQAMYRRFGFAPAGIRKGYYTENNEDAIVMWAHDIATKDYAERLAALEATVKGTTELEGLD